MIIALPLLFTLTSTVHTTVDVTPTCPAVVIAVDAMAASGPQASTDNHGEYENWRWFDELLQLNPEAYTAVDGDTYYVWTDGRDLVLPRGSRPSDITVGPITS